MVENRSISILNRVFVKVLPNLIRELHLSHGHQPIIHKINSIIHPNNNNNNIISLISNENLRTTINSVKLIVCFSRSMTFLFVLNIDLSLLFFFLNIHVCSLSYFPLLVSSYSSNFACDHMCVGIIFFSFFFFFNKHSDHLHIAFTNLINK